MARFPSYRAPSVADLRDELAAQPPGPDAPLEEWGAQDIVIRDGVMSCSLSGRAFIAFGEVCGSHSAFHIPYSALQVRLVAVQPFMEELARCPLLERVRLLDLSGNRIGERGAKALANSPHLGRLRELILTRNNLGGAGLAALREAPWFGQLRVLEIAENNLTKWEARTPKLQELDLSRNPLGPDLVLPCGLKRLALSACGLGIRGAARLTEQGCFADALDVDLSFNDIGAEDWCAATGFPRLRKLNLAFNDLEDAGVEALAAAEFPALESLNLAGNRIAQQGAALLAESHAFEAVHELNLATNPIGDAGAFALVASEGLASLRRLNLMNCELSDAGIHRLARSGALGGLQSLSLAWNALGDAGIRALAACPDLAGLHNLDLIGTWLRMAGAIALIESPHLGNLRSVTLGDNHRLPADAVALIRDHFVDGSRSAAPRG